MRRFALGRKCVKPEKEDDVLCALVDHVVTMQTAFERIAARSVAQQATLQALVLAHPNPVVLFDLYAVQLDGLAVTSPAASEGDFRNELQHFQNLILQAVNSKKPAG